MNLSASKLPIFQRIKYYCKYHKKGIVACSSVFAILVIGLMCYSTFCEPFYKTILTLVHAMIESISNVGSVDTIRGFMDSTVLTDSISGFMGTFTGALQSVAVILCVILWLPTLITAYVNQQAYAELVIKKIMILCISLALISNSTTVCNAIVGIGDGLMDLAGAGDAVSTAVDVGGVIDEVFDEMYTKPYEEYLAEEGKSPEDDEVETPDDASVHTWFLGDFFNSLPKKIYENITRPMKTTGSAFTLVLVLLLPWIISRVGYIIIMVACYSRGIEIVVLTLMSPLPFAVIGNDPFGSGTSVRFMKNLGALAIQGVVMMAIGLACTALLGSQLENLAAALAEPGFPIGDIFGAGFDCCAITVAEAAMLLKSLSISQKVLGLQ